MHASFSPGSLVIAFASHGNVHDRYYSHKTRDMIAGVVAPPRIDIVNKELLEAHLQSTWLSIVKPRLGQSIAEVLDLEKPGYPLQEDLAEQLKVTEHTLREIFNAFDEVVQSGGPELAEAHWYSRAWLEDIAQSASQRFNQASNAGASFTRQRRNNGIPPAKPLTTHVRLGTIETSRSSANAKPKGKFSFS
jgi:hypothetical protein